MTCCVFVCLSLCCVSVCIVVLCVMSCVVTCVWCCVRRDVTLYCAAGPCRGPGAEGAQLL